MSLHHSGTTREPFPRLVLGAASSDSGKTTVAIGLIVALRRRGLTVATAKVGPDFIDATHLARASDRPTRNLDAWLAPEGEVFSSFVRGAMGADVAIVEGVMGLFDGRHGSGEGSTAHVARLLQSPVVLVLDCAKAASTIGAIAYGLARYDARINVAGVILNRVASEKHAATVRDACQNAGLSVLGSLPRNERLGLPSRHLGLCSPEGSAWEDSCAAMGDAIEEHIDLDALLAIANAAPSLEAFPLPEAEASNVRVAIARDQAFWFYDEGSLEALRDRGVRLIEYSPLHDPFPDVDAAFIGGGYPEMYADELEANQGAREGLRQAVQAGMPVYAECGGLMYLTESLATARGTHRMVGVVPANSTMSDRRSALRYVEARSIADGPLFALGESVRGHEFHYSTTSYERLSPAYAFDDQHEGYVTGSAHASYLHVHLSAYPQALQRFIGLARTFSGATL